jgi:hypothetical protein
VHRTDASLSLRAMDASWSDSTDYDLELIRSNENESWNCRILLDSGHYLHCATHSQSPLADAEQVAVPLLPFQTAQ